ncbi:MAG: discoidin domain-containing protein, partial [Planctomycetota bacterium]
MFHQSSKQILLGIFAALLLITMPVYAVENFKISNYGGANQIWFEAEDFDELDPSDFCQVVDEAGAFGKAVTRGGGSGMVRYTFDISAAGGKGGTWYFWGRVTNPDNRSDYMLVEGHPGDAEIPTGPPYPGGSSAPEFNDDDDRIFEDTLGPPWGWGTADHEEGHTKELQNGENTMYIFDRQGNNTVFWDVFVWTDSPDYVPTDEDYQNAAIFIPGPASEPSPANGATDVPREVVLSWTPGDYAAPTNGHIVYFSESFNDVNDGIGGIAQSDTSYTPAQRLNLDTTYYWRVDEVSGAPDYTVYEGRVWSFTTELIAYPISGGNITATASSTHQVDMGPEKTIDGSGLDANDLHSTEETAMWLSSIEPLGAWIQYEFDNVYKVYEMWVWNSNQAVESLVGFGLNNVTIEYSTNGTDYTTLGTTVEFGRAPGAAGYAHNTTVDFGGAAAKYIRLTANSNWGGLLPQYGLCEVRFYHIPVQSRNPNPDSGATGVPIDVVLGWNAGREAAQHDVYLSTDEQAVIDSTAPVTTVTEASYGPLELDLGKIYYWRVDEVNVVETPAMWQGAIWDFTTEEYFVVDDFESYNDLDPTDPESNRIFNVWLDGYESPTNGSLVGYDVPPFCEQSNIHSGKQAMPFFFSNIVGAAYSEAELTLSPPEDWAKHGVKTLSLWFAGDASNTAAQMYVKVNGTKVAYDGNPGNLALSSWQVWNIDLASSGAGLQNVTKLAVGIDGNGASGTLLFDDIRLYALAPAPPNEWRVADDADDVEEAVATGSMDMTSSDLELPYENTGQGNPQIIGVRFTGIPIPKGATITDAWVRFQVDEDKGGTEPVNLIIEGELSANAAGFTSDAFNVSSRSRTTAQ